LLRRKITQIEIELAGLKKDRSDSSNQKREELQKELTLKKETADKLEKAWKQQKQIVEDINRIQTKIDATKIRLETAERDVKLEEAAEIKYGELPNLEKELAEKQTVWKAIPAEEKVLQLEVEPEDIAKVVSRWTGIPVVRLVGSEVDKLINLESKLSERVVGQSTALKAVANAIRRSRAGISDTNKPIATMLFLGPTGVGKTETAKALAETLFNDEKALIRIDMSEYTESHSVARLIGAPPGYVGFEEGGQLTESVRRRPYSVILFDEIEKAHDQVFNVFLQIFDDGRLTDGQGRTVNFKNTVIIMTSNLGSQILSKADLSATDMDGQIWELLQTRFKPEFLNRLDQVITYHRLTKDNLGKIVDIQINWLQKRLEDKKIILDVDDTAKDYLIQFGYDPIFGARPLKRLIQSKIEDELAMEIIDGSLKSGDEVQVKSTNGVLKFVHGNHNK